VLRNLPRPEARMHRVGIDWRRGLAAVPNILVLIEQDPEDRTTWMKSRQKKAIIGRFCHKNKSSDKSLIRLEAALSGSHRE